MMAEEDSSSAYIIFSLLRISSRMSHVSQQLASGALSGLASTLCLQPFDLLKTRIQQGDGSTIQRNTILITKTAKDIVRTQGLRGLWRGTSATLIRNVPGVALYMTGLTQLRSYLSTSSYFATKFHNPSGNNSSVLPKLSSYGNLVSGATTRVGVGFLLNPFSVLKARYESNIYSYESLPQAVGSIVRSGPSELLRGFWASALRDAPYAGLFVVFYESIKRQSSTLFPSSSTAHVTFLHSASAASAGALATIATHPFDVVKTKIQVRSEDRYHGLLKTIATIWRQRGPLGYMDGISLRLTRKVLSSAIGWAVYEGVLIFAKKL